MPHRESARASASRVALLTDPKPSDALPRRVSVQWLIKGLGAGGAEQLLLSIARSADRNRFEFRVAHVLDNEDHLVAPLLTENVSVRSLGGVTRTLDLRWVLALRRHLSRTRPDIIHVHSPLVAAVTRLVTRTIRHPPPIVTTEHNSWTAYERFTRLANRLTFRLDDAHLAVSEAALRSMPSEFREMTEVIVHGVELEKIAAQRAERDKVRLELGVRPDQVVICTVANLRWHKGYPDLLTAARAVIDHGCDVVFLAVGQGPLEADIQARHLELGLGDRFRLLGYRADAVRLLAGADVFVLASLEEGFPIALMEALAVGLPVVVTDVGGMPDAVQSGVEGLVVPRGDPQALAEALTVLAEEPELRRSMATASQEKARAFDISRAVRRTMEIYEALIASREAKGAVRR
jgi:glycosyltransferase involved in cell wall biosynthesis